MAVAEPGDKPQTGIVPGPVAKVRRQAQDMAGAKALHQLVLGDRRRAIVDDVEVEIGVGAPPQRRDEPGGIVAIVVVENQDRGAGGPFGRERRPQQECLARAIVEIEGHDPAWDPLLQMRAQGAGGGRPVPRGHRGAGRLPHVAGRVRADRDRLKQALFQPIGCIGIVEQAGIRGHDPCDHVVARRDRGQAERHRGDQRGGGVPVPVGHHRPVGGPHEPLQAVVGGEGFDHADMRQPVEPAPDPAAAFVRRGVAEDQQMCLRMRRAQPAEGGDGGVDILARAKPAEQHEKRRVFGQAQPGAGHRTGRVIGVVTNRSAMRG